MLIPKKNDINGNEPDRNDNGLTQEQNDWLQAHGCKKLSPNEMAERNREWDAQREKNKDWKFHTNWGRVAEETKFFEGLFVMFFYFTIFMNIIDMPTLLYGAKPQGLACPPLTIACDIILAICLVKALINAGGFNFILQSIMSFIGGFSEPSNITFEDLEKSRQRDAQKHQETADRCAKYYEKKADTDVRDFNTKQKEARKAAAYAKADPEFEVSYKSRGGCWVREIIRGRDKAEVYNRYKYNPMVDPKGGIIVTGIYE